MFSHKIPQFLQIVAENYMKILKHGGLREKLLATINHVQCLTRTTSWNLPGPSGTRDCINVMNSA